MDRKRGNIFISYSRKDREWLERLQVHLRPLARSTDIVVWDDSRLAAGAQWQTELEEAMRQCRVAITLISADFLASDFIWDVELKTLIEYADSRDLTLIPLLVSPSRFLKTPELARFHTFNDASKPLKGMTEVEVEQCFTFVVDAVEESLSKPPRVPEGPVVEWGLHQAFDKWTDEEVMKHGMTLIEELAWAQVGSPSKLKPELISAVNALPISELKSFVKTLDVYFANNPSGDLYWQAAKEFVNGSISRIDFFVATFFPSKEEITIDDYDDSSEKELLDYTTKDRMTFARMLVTKMESSSVRLALVDERHRNPLGSFYVGELELGAIASSFRRGLRQLKKNAIFPFEVHFALITVQLVKLFQDGVDNLIQAVEDLQELQDMEATPSILSEYGIGVSMEQLMIKLTRMKVARDTTHASMMPIVKAVMMLIMSPYQGKD